MKKHAEKCGYPAGPCVCDGYHTFDELYEHRFALFERLTVEEFSKDGINQTWRSRLHADGTMYDGWFIAGIDRDPGDQISYHLPLRLWDRFDHCKTLERAPEWDGHTPDDVLDRLRRF